MNYTHVTFTEEDFVKNLSAEQVVKWKSLRDTQQKSIWEKLKKAFPFDLGNHTEYDPHTNWVEAWDTEEEVTTHEKWDFHAWIKSEITCVLEKIDIE